MHEPLDVELSILKQRLARRLVSEGYTDESVKTELDLVKLTQVGDTVQCITCNAPSANMELMGLSG